jgi:predicted phage tail component-like protein
MAVIDKSAAWFSFAGTMSHDMKVYMVELPVRPMPAMKGDDVEIPGTDGNLWMSDGGYERITVSVKLEAGDDADIDLINGWLRGEGDLIFGDEPDRVYHARIIKNADRSHKGKRTNRQWKQTFDCEPYRYLADCANLLPKSTEYIMNPGNVASAPLILVNGYGDGTVMIGNNTLIFNDLDGHIFVDNDAKIAYTGGTSPTDPMILATQHLTGEWIKIQPGRNFVTFTDGITSIEIAPRWRWL